MVMTTTEALRLFEACLIGRLLHAARRPHDIERETLIRSGSVFIYEETACGIKRWTDGRKWSPSRILGNFLIYREMRKDVPAGTKKKAIKRKRDDTSDDQDGITSLTNSAGPPIDEGQRALVGSLTSSYLFKEGGLMKKTISIRFHGVWHHLVSYYSLEDANSGRLPTPSQFPDLCMIRPRRELITDQDFRSPIHLENPRLLEEATYDIGSTNYGHGHQPHMEQTVPLPPMQMTVLQPYGVPAQSHMPLPMTQPTSPDSHMGGPFDHNASNSMSWNHQALPQPTQHSYQLPGMVGNANERRHTDAWEATNTTADLLSPSGMGHGPDMTTGGHQYYAPPVTASYAPSTTLPPTTLGTEAMGFMPAATSMAPPSRMSVMTDVPVTTMDYTPPVSAMVPMTMDFPPSVGAMAPTTSMGFAPPAHPQAPTGHLDSPVGGPSMNVPAMLRAQPVSTLDGSNGDPQYYSPMNTAGWHYAHDHPAYSPGSGSAMNGWPSRSVPDDEH